MRRGEKNLDGGIKAFRRKSRKNLGRSKANLGGLPSSAMSENNYTLPEMRMV